MANVSKVVLAGLVSLGLAGAAASYAAVTDSANASNNDTATTGMSPPGTHVARYRHQAAPSPYAAAPMGPASTTSETRLPKVRDSATSDVDK